MFRTPNYFCIGLSVMLFNGCALISAEYEPQAALNLEIGHRHLQMGLYDSALPYLEKALSLDSQNPAVQIALGEYYLGIQTIDQAGNYFKTAFAEDEDDPDIRSSYGHYLCAKGASQQGIAMIQESLDNAHNSQPWLAETRLAQCYTLSQEQSLAEYHLRQALLAREDYMPALLAMQKLSYHNHQYQQAKEFWQRYCRIGKVNAESLWLALQTERALGNAELSAVYRQQLLTEFPDSVQAQQTRTAISN